MSKKIRVTNKLTRRERRDLDIEISFLEGVAQRDPGCLEALHALGENYFKRGRYAEALRIDEYFAQLDPGDADRFYRLACGYSITRQLDHAVLALSRAIDCGYQNFHRLRRDPHLSNLRRSRHFQKVRAHITARQIAPEPKAA